MKKKDETLRQTLLEYARHTVEINGPDAINIRDIAKCAGIATGTVYNYFRNKDEIILALTEEYWKTALSDMHQEITTISFCEQLKEIYEFLKQRVDHPAGLLMNSLRSVEADGQERMASAQEILKHSLIQRLEQDPAIREHVWIDSFTREDYAGFILGNLMLALRSGQSDIGFLIEIVKRTIY